MLRSAVFAKYPGSLISKSYDQNKFSCFPLMKTARINEKGGLYKGENLACSHVQIQDPKKKAAHSKNAFWRSKKRFSSIIKLRSKQVFIFSFNENVMKTVYFHDKLLAKP